MRVRGIEPPTTAWKAVVLPLNYTREMSTRIVWWQMQTLLASAVRQFGRMRGCIADTPASTLFLCNWTKKKLLQSSTILAHCPYISMYRYDKIAPINYNYITKYWSRNLPKGRGKFGHKFTIYPSGICSFKRKSPRLRGSYNVMGNSEGSSMYFHIAYITSAMSALYHTIYKK